MSVTTGTFPGVRIVDMPDLGVVNDTSSVVGERAGSGRFAATALRDYTRTGMAAYVPTIAALRALASGAAAVFVQGYYAAGDGGGGFYNLGAAGTDNGGSVIVSANGTYLLDTNGAPVSVKQFGAKGDGTAPDSAAINAASAQGGIVYFPPGTYMADATCVMSTGVTWQGAGEGVTTIKAMNGTTMDVVQTSQFATLTGGNTATGPYQWAIKQMTIDGNKASRSAGRCAAFYGYDFVIEDVAFANAHGDCVYSEWATDPGVPVAAGGNSMESHWTRVKTFGSAAGNGMTFHGPHDSVFVDYLTFINGAIGAVWSGAATYSAAASIIASAHAYGNTGDGFVIQCEIYATNLESESNQGAGIVVSATGAGGELQATNVNAWANHGHGFYTETGGSVVTNLVSSSSVTGAGVYVNGPGNVFANVSAVSNANTGVYIAATGGETQMSNVQVTQNLGSGLVINANDCAVTTVVAQFNNPAGIELVSGVLGTVLNGKIINSVTGALLRTLGGANRIDLQIFTAAGQTAYTGTVGNNDVCLNCTGASSTSLRALSDTGVSASGSNTTTAVLPLEMNGTVYYVLARTTP